jgi:hypothetical protein
MEQSISRTLVLLVGVLCLLLCPTRASFAQAPSQAQITWEVANRFRLFTSQKDFDLHFNAWWNNGAGRSILETERTLEKEFEGKGWAASIVGRLCYNSDTGQVLKACKRDNGTEDYLKPDSHLIKLKVSLPAQFSAAQCTWTIGEAPGAKSFDLPCSTIVADQKVPDNKPVPVHVVAKTTAGQTTAGDATVLARDFLIVGMGDSTASGEGNPDRPIALSDLGFCFERIIFSGEKFYLPGREKAIEANIAPACEDDANDLQNWDKTAAGWLYAPCHRSLYSYQTRAALALAVQNPDISVTFIPLGCTGATVKNVEYEPQNARERQPGEATPRTVQGQLIQLAAYLGNKATLRPIDLIFLTVGANDIGFSALVADVIVNKYPERRIVTELGLITSPDAAKGKLTGSLKSDFGNLRNQLARYVDGDLERVVFVPYGDPARHQGGSNCPTSRIGFDAHPAFSVDGAELTKVVDFVENPSAGFLKTLKDYAVCGDAAAGCSDPAKQRMTFAADHQPAFLDHGFCASSDSDPEFDRTCFKNGGSFAGSATGLVQPLTCGHKATQFQPYAERARWIRTANDSYFTAMTFPWAPGLVENPDYIHDGYWGLASVVYGGVMHPTAEGHAAMADAALAAASTILKLPLHSANSGFVQ